MDTLTDIGALLLKWKETGQPVVVLFSSASDPSASWRRTGKIIDVLFTKFEVSWVDGESEHFLYHSAASIAESGTSLFIPDISGDRVVVYEEPS